MDNQEFFIAITVGIIVVLCVILFIIPFWQDIDDSRKNRDESEEHSDTRRITKPTASTTSAAITSSTSATDRSTTTYTRNNTEKQYSPKPSQKSIYEFEGKQSVRLCPICDGENELEAKVCEICKRDI